jgi:phospholipid-binding lipoprotein MlaA
MSRHDYVFGLLILFIMMGAPLSVYADVPDSPILLAHNVYWAQSSQDASSDDEKSKQSEEDEYGDEYDDEIQLIADPIIGINRGFYHFNDKLYFWVLKPVARGYGFIVPDVIREGIRNFFHNIRFPGRFINCMLQAKTDKAAAEFATFYVNTVVGLLGFFDPAADDPRLHPSPEDTGQTFAVWGAGFGPYFKLPFLGPSSGRDTLGLVGDTVMDPLFWLLDFWPEGLAVRAGTTVNNTSMRIGDYEALKEAALDPYVAIRNAYVQNRIKLIAE